MFARTCYFCMMFLLLLPALAFFSQTAVSGEQFIRTPADYEGPFYPLNRQQDEDNDLIHVSGQTEPTKGDILYLSGEVVDTSGQPVENAIVEIWQTDSQGLYRDQRDRSPGARDPNFQYWGKTQVKADGSFSFTTIVPGKYEPRPAHIHFKVWIEDKAVLTSQLYFSNHPQEGGKDVPIRTPPQQTVGLEKTSSDAYETFFRIVL
ncbi:MAG: hypothetical protein SCH71_10140 [Desulfobulbaceae bacterium]|nr:hypothetical protein [Desulfobulbaceae bacterium]